jgi:hypothetical protein
MRFDRREQVQPAAIQTNVAKNYSTTFIRSYRPSPLARNEDRKKKRFSPPAIVSGHIYTWLITLDRKTRASESPAFSFPSCGDLLVRRSFRTDSKRMCEGARRRVLVRVSDRLKGGLVGLRRGPALFALYNCASNISLRI